MLLTCLSSTYVHLYLLNVSPGCMLILFAYFLVAVVVGWERKAADKWIIISLIIWSWFIDHFNQYSCGCCCCCQFSVIIISPVSGISKPALLPSSPVWSANDAGRCSHHVIRCSTDVLLDPVHAAVHADASGLRCGWSNAVRAANDAILWSDAAAIPTTEQSRNACVCCGGSRHACVSCGGSRWHVSVHACC